MMTKPTTYHRPTTLDEALRLAAQPDAIALAGGALTFGALELPYTTIVDLQAIPELRQIEANENGVTLGGAVTLQAVIESPHIHSALKRSLTRALPLNIRNGATVGESLSVPNPPREWLAALVALDVGVEKDGTNQWDNIASMVEGWSDRTLGGGILTRVHIPALREGEALGAAFVARTPADEPFVNAAAFVRLDARGRVETAFAAVGGASAEPVVNIRLSTLEGNPLDEANIASAVKLVAPHVAPLEDYRGSVEYRREMARVTVQRALAEAMAVLG